MNSLLRNPIYTDLYLSIVLGLDDECKRILTDDSIRKKEGIKESLVSMIHFYKRYDLLGLRLYSLFYPYYSVIFSAFVGHKKD